jgi:hypothetical protein
VCFEVTGKVVLDVAVLDRQEANRGCKGCGDSYRVTESQIARALAALASEPDRCVPDEIYLQRLAACAACEKQFDGVTCSMCGCIIPVAAKLRERVCPLPGSGRWAHLN